MRYLATALVVLMVLVAGCNTADTGTPTPEATTANGTATPSTTGPGGASTNATVDASAVPGVEGSELTNPSALLGAFSRSLTTGPVDFETSYQTGNTGENVNIDLFTFQLRNDTQQQEYVLNSSDRQVSYYVDGESAAVRNDTTGEVRYSNQTNALRSEATGTGIYAVVSISAINALEWEATGTTTVHGEQHYVLESTGINQTALEQSSLSADGVTSTDGRLVVGTDGIIHDGTVNIDGETAVSVSFSTRTGDSIAVDAPSWYDESAAN